MRVLISGAGIAGPTLAYLLDSFGFETTIVEKAPRLRTGGYMIDFWGSGFEVADRMNLLDEIKRQGYMVDKIRVVDRAGKRVAGFPAAAFARATHGHHVSLQRGDLAALIFARIESRVESIFGDSISTIIQDNNSVRVTFASGLQREFDLVIGADGLHSRVRELVFGPENGFERFLGYKAAAFGIDGYRPRDELVYVMYTEVGQQVPRFAMRGDRTMFLFTFADSDPDSGDVSAEKELLRRRFGGSGWECPSILDALDHADDFYFDPVSQIRWIPGRAGAWRWWEMLRIASHCYRRQHYAVMTPRCFTAPVLRHCDCAALRRRHSVTLWRYGAFMLQRHSAAVLHHQGVEASQHHRDDYAGDGGDGGGDDGDDDDVGVTRGGGGGAARRRGQGGCLRPQDVMVYVPNMACQAFFLT